MSYKVWVLLLLLSTNCYSQEMSRPNGNNRFDEFNPESQLMRSLSQPTSVPTYSAPGSSGKLSIAELSLRPKAVHEMELSEKANLSGDWRGSAKHLEKVLAIDPQYWPAHDKLGRLYVILREYDRGVEEFKKASASEPLSAKPLNHLSATLFLMGRYAEVESVARATLEVDPAQTETRYILGCALVAQGRFTAETVEQLRLSGSQIPTARLVLADVLYRRGALPEAAAELRAYLEVPGAAEKEQVQSWLVRLKRKIDDPNNRDSSTD
ncbi:MAG: tetratricopeptide repeat protein [Candidatus Acidiferrum sp.]